MKKESSLVSIFSEFIYKYPLQFFRLFVFLILEGFASVLSMLAIIPMADYFVDPSLVNISKVTYFTNILFGILNIQSTFWTFGLLFVFLNLLKGILEVTVKYAILKVKYSIVGNLFNEALGVFFKSRWEFFSSSDNGILLNTLNKELNTIGDTLGHIAMLLAQVVQLIIFLAVPFWLNHVLTLTVLGISLVMTLPFFLLSKLSYRLGKINTETANDALGILSEILQAARLILGFGKQDAARNLFLNSFNKHVKATLFSQILTVAIPKFFQPLAMMSVVIGIGIAIKQHTPISELAAIMWSFLAALPILSSILQGNISIKNFLPSYEQLVALRSKAESLVEIEGDIQFKNFNHGIEFKDVNFTYPGREYTLKKLNLIIPKGKMIALVGESGSGKSTITDLVLGLQIPTCGDLLIDGVSLKSYKQNSFRLKIGYVPQDPLLFNSSIRDNLIWANDQATEFEIWDALNLANADKFVRDLPEGLETFVGDRGVRLSGGQRQRIALARALIRKPELLILDEATSSLDTESEKLIQKSIEDVSIKTTVLVVAHRLSTISKADIVYVLSKGSIIEQGTFNELRNSEFGNLNRMFKSQIEIND